MTTTQQGHVSCDRCGRRRIDPDGWTWTAGDRCPDCAGDDEQRGCSGGCGVVRGVDRRRGTEDRDSDA